MGTPVRRPHYWQGDPPSCGDGGHEQDGWSYVIHSLPSANLQGSTESRQEPPTASPTGKPRQPSQGQRFTVHFGWHGLFKVAVGGLGGRQADALICHVGIHVAVLSWDSLGLWAVELWAPTAQGRGPEQRVALPNPAPRQLGELAPGAVFLAACCWELTGAHGDTLLWGHTGSFSDAWDLRDQLRSDTALLGVLPQVLQDRACLALEGEPPEPAPAQGHRGLWTRAPGHVCAHAS